uniref:Homeobox domain-containing protein n=1 Tax=Mus spicilegus TaxID=10103 RepID=A0A8C6GB66_MUSSI
MEETDMTIFQMRLKDRRTVEITKMELTDVQFQKLRKHFETDRYPNEETLQALAEGLKLQKEVIRSWFITQRQRMMEHRWFFMRYYRDWITCCEYSTTRRIARQKNSKECSQNDPGLSEALEAIKRLKLSSGYQSRDGMSQDF